MKLVSVIIPARNEEKIIGKAVRSMLAQNYPRKEIIVMDNASTDSTAEIAKKYKVRVIRNEKNIGYVSSVNKGIRLSNGDYTILLHADHFAKDKNWINKIIEPFSDKSVAAVVSQRMNKNRNKMNFAEKLFDSLSPIDRNRSGKPQEVSTLRGKADAYRKSTIKSLGYFDEESYPHGGDDIDMSIRLHKAGYKILLSDKAMVEHVFSSSQNSLLAIFRKCFQMGRAGTNIYRKYKIDALRRRMQLVSMSALLFIPFMLTIIGLVLYSMLFFLGIFSKITIFNKKIPVSLVSVIFISVVYIYTNNIFSISAGTFIAYLSILSYFGIHSVKNAIAEGDSMIYSPFVFIFSIICRFLFGLGYLMECLMPAKK